MLNDFQIDLSKIKNEVFIEGQKEKSNNDNYNFNKNKYEFLEHVDLSKYKLKEENYIDGLAEEENIDIGFDLSLLKREELYVNLIHFDLKMTNDENYKYFSKFKVDVVGGFLAIDDLEIFKKYLKAIENKNIPFIVISSGTSGKDVIPICRQYSFVKEVIIFCAKYEHNKHYIEEYPGYVKKVLTNIKSVYKYIKTFENEYKDGTEKFKDSNHFIFPPEFIKMNKQLEQCPVISAYEYDNCYFLIHKAYAHFFGDMDDKKVKAKFTKNNFEHIKTYINETKLIKENNKKDLIKKFENLKNNDNFVEESIKTYTGESDFCYIFNRTMRNFEKGLISLAYYMGPLLFGLNKYVKDHPNPYSFKEDMTLYRNIVCSKLDFYLYKINLNHIICFPSITSTSTVKGKFNPTLKSKEINKIGMSEDDFVKITMIFNYKHIKDNISPGIIVKDNKGVNSGEYLSLHKKENEVILFPFTFVRIKKIEKDKQKGNNVFIMELDIINRNKYIEYTLKDNFEKRFLLSNLD